MLHQRDQSPWPEEQSGKSFSILQCETGLLLEVISSHCLNYPIFSNKKLRGLIWTKKISKINDKQYKVEWCIHSARSYDRSHYAVIQKFHRQLSSVSIIWSQHAEIKFPKPANGFCRQCCRNVCLYSHSQAQSAKEEFRQ